MWLQVTPRELPGLEALEQGEDSDSDGDHLGLLNGEADGTPFSFSLRPWENSALAVHPAGCGALSPVVSSAAGKGGPVALHDSCRNIVGHRTTWHGLPPSQAAQMLALAPQ